MITTTFYVYFYKNTAQNSIYISSNNVQGYSFKRQILKKSLMRSVVLVLITHILNTDIESTYKNCQICWCRQYINTRFALLNLFRSLVFYQEKNTFPLELSHQDLLKNIKLNLKKTLQHKSVLFVNYLIEKNIFPSNIPTGDLNGHDAYLSAHIDFLSDALKIPKS